MEFKDLLARIVERFPTKKAFAAEMGMDPSRLTRAINAGDFPFNVENCLKLAKVSGESPSDVLRAAGKGDVAELIESLYGKDRTRLLSTEHREILHDYEAMSPRAREAFRTLMNDLAESKKPIHRAQKRTA